jgi:hypothetical protein
VLGYIKPLKGLLFFVCGENYITKYNFENSTLLGFSNVTVIKSSRAHISFLAAINLEVKIKLLNYIVGFFNIPKITIELDLRNNYNWEDDVKFLSSFGFANPVKSPSTENVEMTLLPPGYLANLENNVRTITAIAQSTMFLCKLNVYFPEDLAKLLEEYARLQSVEYGGRIFIEDYVTDSQGKKIAVLGTKPAYFDKGDDTSVTLGDTYRMAFHTHPEQTYYTYNMYISWPSSSDLNVSVYSYFTKTPILAQFIASVEGIWVYHLTPMFQKFIYDVKRSTPKINDCYNAIRTFNIDKFDTHEDRKRVNTPLELRTKVRDAFIEKSQELKIDELLRTDSKFKNEYGHLIRENFNLYDVKLIKWKIFYTNKVIMSFSYISDPEGGLSCEMEIDAPYKLLNYSSDEKLPPVEDMDEDTIISLFKNVNREMDEDMDTDKDEDATSNKAAKEDTDTDTDEDEDEDEDATSNKSAKEDTDTDTDEDEDEDEDATSNKSAKEDTDTDTDEDEDEDEDATSNKSAKEDTDTDTDEDEDEDATSNKSVKEDMDTDTDEDL